MKYKAVLFDLDGTTLETLEDLSGSVNFALAKNNYPTHSIDAIRLFVGNGIRKLMERSCPDGTSVENVDKVHHDFTEHYKVHCNDKTRPYDGILEMLSTLKQHGIKLAVLSNKADYAVKDLCRLHFDGLFDEARGEVAGVPRKPSPEGVNIILEKLNVKPDECAYIGDSDVDVETARNSGLDCIAVDWGFRDRDNLINAGAKIIVSTAEELTKELTK